MHRLALTAALALAAAPLARADAATWKLDPMHSHVSFSVRHLGISNVRGDFQKFEATLFTDGEDPAKARVEAVVDVSSVDTRVEKRDADLRSERFFDVAKYPQMTFRSTKVKKSGRGKLQVTGDLTLHGTTKPVTLDVELSPAIKDQKGAQRRAVQANGKINRRDFGLSFSEMVERAPVVGDDVQLDIAGEFVEAPASPSGQAKAEDAAMKGKPAPADSKK